MSFHYVLGQAAEETVRLEPGGAIVMTASILLVVLLAGFCMYRVLRERSPAEHHHVPSDIDTQDQST